MGDFTRKRQAENFRKARDKAIRDAQQQSLIQRELNTTVAFTIKPIEGQRLVPNEPLILLAQDEGVSALRGHECVGIVDGEAAEIAKITMTESGSPHAVKVMVTVVAEMSGIAQAQLLTQ